MSILAENLQQVRENIQLAASRAGRDPADVLLLAVTKLQPIEALQEAYNLGLRDFGESRVQELMKKAELLPEDVRWHLIGHLQSNKAKYLAAFVHLVHSVDSVQTGHELARRAEQAERTVDILLEVNISGEAQKNGVAPDRVEEYLNSLSTLAGIRLRGLMGMASYEDDLELVRPQFKLLKSLFDRVRAAEQFEHFDQLSMGMTNDYAVAIEEGSTIVRIGSALFGSR